METEVAQLAVPIFGFHDGVTPNIGSLKPALASTPDNPDVCRWSYVGWGCFPFAANMCANEENSTHCAEHAGQCCYNDKAEFIG
jgi:hypothetical protein